MANRQQSVDPPIDVEDAEQRLDKKIARLMRGLKPGETGGELQRVERVGEGSGSGVQVTRIRANRYQP